MIIVVDSGIANVGSVVNMFRKVGTSALASGDPNVVAGASKLVLPGIGAFDSAMESLRALQLVDVIRDLVERKHLPTLGICLGMQLLMDGSDEGVLPGFGWIEGRARRFSFTGGVAALTIPHMGWNEVTVRKPCPYFDGVSEPQRFYFAHSFHATCERAADVLAAAHYGYEFAAAIQRDNVAGVQFHPEKSHRFGMRLLKAFAEH